MNERYDCIIVGSGAGGSAAAYRLASDGRRVLLLEKGLELPRDGSTLDVDKVIRQGIFKSKEPWLDRKGRAFEPEEYFNLGGKTKWYGAALARFEPHEFEAEPAHQCLPWPLAYPELAPYYEQAEELLGVHRFEPEPDLRAIVGKLTGNGAGWHARPLALALDPSIVQHPEEAAHFDAFASVKNLKADGQHALLERVQHLPNLAILTGQTVRDFIADPDRSERLIGVRGEDGGEFQAETVLLAAGALHSPRLLQNYLTTTGLAERLPCAKTVGRNYKSHLLSAVLAFSATPKTDLLRKTLLLLNERLPHSSIQPLGFDGELLSTLIPGFVPRWFARTLGHRAYGFFLQTEDGSDPANRVVAKANGAQYPQLDYDPARLPAAREEHRRLVRDFNQSLLRIGLPAAAKTIPLAGTAHACGTLVAGHDPETSVVDANGKVHGLDNLYVVDGSILPRSSRVNPSLTIYAWALRVAEQLSRREQPA
ncbi:MAG: GMC family oxidoreductase [Candidatus Competibacter sp.]|nr:GMC family oxidoreductase [Candidatus Competibacter sp.]MDG4582961.1 GMC family oxidoreductase [Candidatus Competibacter sp.]